MTALRIIAAIALADLRQRLRVPRTWVVLVALAIASWWSFPPIEADYLTVSIGGAAGARAHYSSAWIGLVIAAIQGAMLSLAGFYVVRGTVVRDLETGETIFEITGEDYEDRLGVARISEIVSSDGIPIGKDRRYELVCEYENTGTADTDAMAILYLYASEAM